MKGKIKPYFGAGVSSIKVKMDLIDSVLVTDHVDAVFYFEDYYPYEWVEIDEAIEIAKVGFTQESETVWGFHAKVGVDFELTKSICIFGEARYLSAKVEFDRPEVTFTSKVTVDIYVYAYGYEEEWTETQTETERIDIGDTVETKVGGVQAILGIKFVF